MKYIRSSFRGKYGILRVRWCGDWLCDGLSQCADMIFVQEVLGSIE
jgi:hypothetical protein